MKAKTAIKAKNKKKLYLFIPAIVVLLLLDAAAFTLAVQAQNVWLFGGSFVLLALTLIAVWQLASLSKSINKFYQTMEKQLSPYSNKALRDFPLPVLVTRRRGGEIIWYNNQMREKVFGGNRLLRPQPGGIFSHGKPAGGLPSAGLRRGVWRPPVHRLPRADPARRTTA